jgi:excisionase family DNA binding protein
MPDPLVYDLRGAAAQLAHSPWTIRRWIRLGRLHPTRLGGKVLVTHAELLRFLQEGQQERVATATTDALPSE